MSGSWLRKNWWWVLLIAIAIVVAAYVATLFITQLVTSSMNDDLPSQGNLLGKWYVMFQYGDFIDCPFSSIMFPAVDGNSIEIVCYKSNSYLDMVTPIDTKTWASVVHTDLNDKTSYGVSRILGSFPLFYENMTTLYFRNGAGIGDPTLAVVRVGGLGGSLAVLSNTPVFSTTHAIAYNSVDTMLKSVALPQLFADNGDVGVGWKQSTLLLDQVLLPPALPTPEELAALAAAILNARRAH
jgi:hypothetical protein